MPLGLFFYDLDTNTLTDLTTEFWWCWKRLSGGSYRTPGMQCREIFPKCFFILGIIDIGYFYGIYLLCNYAHLSLCNRWMVVIYPKIILYCCVRVISKIISRASLFLASEIWFGNVWVYWLWFSLNSYYLFKCVIFYVKPIVEIWALVHCSYFYNTKSINICIIYVFWKLSNMQVLCSYMYLEWRQKNTNSCFIRKCYWCRISAS